MWSWGALVVGFGLALLFGDPRNDSHPVVLIGTMISTLETA